jgi:hypothetical protein
VTGAGLAQTPSLAGVFDAFPVTGKSRRRSPASRYRPAGPTSDPWLLTWAQIDPLFMSGLAALAEHPEGDDLVTADPDLRAAVSAATSSEHELLRRALQSQSWRGSAGLTPSDVREAWGVMESPTGDDSRSIRNNSQRGATDGTAAPCARSPGWRIA